MSKNPYLILGVPENATQSEIEEAYRALVDKYGRERFEEGEVGERASRMLNEVYAAYDEAMEKAKQASFISEGKDIFYEVISCIKANQIDEAQQKLDNLTERSAKWNYLQANIYYKRGWLVECRNQLEIALKMEPDNEKYKKDLEKLVKEMNPSFAFGDGKTAHPEGRTYSDTPVGGGDMCDACGACLCANCLCNCCWS